MLRVRALPVHSLHLLLLILLLAGGIVLALGHYLIVLLFVLLLLLLLRLPCLVVLLVYTDGAVSYLLVVHHVSAFRGVLGLQLCQLVSVNLLLVGDDALEIVLALVLPSLAP